MILWMTRYHFRRKDLVNLQMIGLQALSIETSH